MRRQSSLEASRENRFSLFGSLSRVAALIAAFPSTSSMLVEETPRREAKGNHYRERRMTLMANRTCRTSENKVEAEMSSSGWPASFQSRRPLLRCIRGERRLELGKEWREKRNEGEEMETRREER
ncbi:DEAD/DEAH box helicase domain-containing protein [Toxoplasma gondii VAND]|uniref:DEAD/DEAH box helicase domain-containing protein n=1 Tax=Toxoplasma gondii VAND TaxID=933077 RepID=A0A086PNE9_TOXGO|nr:DEAD/DEAH box helicase domain-containing protein [Toxoplasma gondii VAND]